MLIGFLLVEVFVFGVFFLFELFVKGRFLCGVL